MGGRGSYSLPLTTSLELIDPGADCGVPQGRILIDNDISEGSGGNGELHQVNAAIIRPCLLPHLEGFRPVQAGETVKVSGEAGDQLVVNVRGFILDRGLSLN